MTVWCDILGLKPFATVHMAMTEAEIMPTNYICPPARLLSSKAVHSNPHCLLRRLLSSPPCRDLKPANILLRGEVYATGTNHLLRSMAVTRTWAWPRPGSVTRPLAPQAARRPSRLGAAFKVAKLTCWAWAQSSWSACEQLLGGVCGGGGSRMQLRMLVESCCSSSVGPGNEGTKLHTLHM